jgi:hypothetical protein
MKPLFQLASLMLLVLSACNPENQKPAVAEDDIDAARNFIRAALDGDYKHARTMIVDDSTNKQSLDLYEWNYNNKISDDDRKAYKSSSIRMLDVHKLNDSVTIVHYSNSYKDKPDSMKVVKLGGRWLVDLNFAFQKNDSLPQ